MFKLPNDDGCILGEPVKDITQEPLRFAVHPGKDRPMIAMATTTYGDLKILVSDENVGNLCYLHKMCLYVKVFFSRYIIHVQQILEE